MPARTTLFALLLGACSWGKFDDLRDEAWVRAVENPDDDSANWAVAIQRGNRESTSGGRLAVFGSSQTLFNELLYKADGSVEVSSNQQKLNSQFGIGNLDPQPIVLADPATDDIALITKSGGASIAVLHGTNGQLAVTPIFGPDIPEAATFMVAPGFGALPSPQPAQPLVSKGDEVFGAFYTPPEPNFQQPKCKLMNGADAVTIRALGTYRPAAAMTDDVIVWSGAGELLIYPSDVFNGTRGTVCAGGTVATPTAAVDTGFSPGLGSQILAVDGRHVVLQGHSDGGAGFLALYDLEAVGGPAIVGPPRTDAGIAIATMLDLGTEQLVVVGYPGARIDGVASGQVQAFTVSTSTGISTNPVVTLYDAQPDEDQSFGRGVAAMRFNGRNIIVVAANNEVFAYYRTAVYDDARMGR